MTTIQGVVNYGSETILHSASAAAVGYLCANVFMPAVNPAAAAVVLGAAATIAQMTRPIFNSIFAGPTSNEASRFLGTVLNITASVAIPASIAAGLGYAISVTSALYLIGFAIGSFALVIIGTSALSSTGISLRNALHLS